MTMIPASHSSLATPRTHAASQYSAPNSSHSKQINPSDQEKNKSAQHATAAKKEYEAQLKKDYQKLQKSIAEDAYVIDLGPLAKQVIKHIISK